MRSDGHLNKLKIRETQYVAFIMNITGSTQNCSSKTAALMYNIKHAFSFFWSFLNAGCQGLLYLNVHYSVVLKLLSYIRCRFERLVLKPKYVK